MKRLSKYLLLSLLFVILFSIPAAAESNYSIDIFIKGRPLLEVVPVTSNNRTMVPIESISEGLGFTVDYVEESKTININKDHKNIEIEIDSTKAIVDGKEVQLDVKPFIKDGDIFVPLRFIAESLGEEVIWIEKDKIILLGEFDEEANIEDTYLYYNEELRYTLSLPNSWKEEAIIETKDDGTLYVYDRESYEKFKEDGIENFGPVLEIRSSDYPVNATTPYDDPLLSYMDGKYIESIFGRDFQFYPETAESYKKIYAEAEKVLGSFRLIKEDYEFVQDDSNNYQKEIQVLNDILDNYVPENIFNRDEIFTYKKPVYNTSFLYMRNMENEEEVSIKIESEFDKDANLIYYNFKSYHHELEENQISQEEALKLANDFINKYVDENAELVKKADLYSSLYEKDKHETYGDEEGKYVVVVDLVHGFVEYKNSLLER